MLLVDVRCFLLTLSEARILKEAMTCSAVSVSAVSRVMKSMKAWKVTTPVLLGSTRVMMRANSTSPCQIVIKLIDLVFKCVSLISELKKSSDL